MWFIVALVVGAGITALIYWLRSRDIKVSWYEWLIGAVGLLLLLFAIQSFAASLAEDESTAANMYLLVTGLPALVLLAVAWQFVWRRHRADGS